jgi:hypothetical protein
MAQPLLWWTPDGRVQFRFAFAHRHVLERVAITAPHLLEEARRQIVTFASINLSGLMATEQKDALAIIALQR